MADYVPPSPHRTQLWPGLRLACWRRSRRPEAAQLRAVHALPVFGRRREEACAVALAGIPFQIVRGTVAASTPRTCRQLARGTALAAGRDIKAHAKG